MQISGREEALQVDSVVAHRWLLQVWTSEFRYSLRRWLPLSAANYATYQQLEGIVEKTEFLQRILIGNILSLCTGLGVHLDKQVTCTILKIENEHPYRYKGVLLHGMDVMFRTNVSLADFVGLGKGVSVGYGMICKMHERKENNRTED